MNYTTPTNNQNNVEENLENTQEEIDAIPAPIIGSIDVAEIVETSDEDESDFQAIENHSLSDLPSESPIAFDKSAILPLEELEVNYEWISLAVEYNQNTIQLKTLEGSESNSIESEYFDESATLSKKTSSSDMKSKSNLFLGIIVSLIGALGAAYTWGKTTMLIDEYIEQHHYAFMAVLVGLLASLGMRLGGRGHRSIFGIMAILITVLGFFVGNSLAAVEPIVQSFQLSYIETFTTFDASHLWGFLKDRFEYVDIAFYALGIFFAYYFSFTKKKHLFRK